MKELSSITKLTPETRIKQTDRFLDLLMDDNRKDEGQLSSREKSELYGIEVTALDKHHKAYNIKETVLEGEKHSKITLNKPFKVISKKDMTKWICLYRKSNYNDADYLFKSLSKASQGYGLVIFITHFNPFRF